jgi:dihydrofolate reductase
VKQVETVRIISHLVALSNNSVIGVDNNLPWTLKADLKHFSTYTQNKTVVMGKNTFLAIGYALPNRKNIVLSSKMKSSEEIHVASSLKDALSFAESWNIRNYLENEIVIIGGGEVFNQTLDIANKLVITRVNCDIVGDVFYPNLDLSKWKIADSSFHQSDSENEYEFTIETYLLE